MASVGQAYYQVVMMNGNEYTKASNVTADKLFRDPGQTTNLVTALGKTAFTKVGIQAPPGTQIVINESHTIIIGRSGLYELEAQIESLYVKPINVYVKNINNADGKSKIEEGASEIKEVYEDFEKWVDTIPDGDTPWQDSDYNTFMETEGDFTAALKAFQQATNSATSTYLDGIASLWTITSTQYIENIIIDYEY